MPMSKAAMQDYDAKAWRLAITRVKAYRQQTINVSGVTCKIYIDRDDPSWGAKFMGIQDGVTRVVNAGFSFPNGIDFYTSALGGFQTVAFHRDLSPSGGTLRKAVVLLGLNSVNTGGMIGRLGIADTVNPKTPQTYCEAVVVHELGHNLHERESPEFFWMMESNAPLAGAPCQLALAQISQYASTNKKEVVAEVFTGILYSKAFSRAVLNLYEEYEGPRIPNPPRGGGRGRSNRI